MFRHSAKTLNELFKQGDLSAKSIAEKTLERIEKYDTQVDAFLAVFNEPAMRKAEELDQKRKANKPLGRLAGVPIAIKDNINVKGELTTCASKFLENYRAVFDATVIRLLEAEDAILIGKTNMDEFAMGSTTENSAFKKTKNPWNLACTPGGSSGGSSAAVAARLCPLSFGSDTGGSIRQPAGLTGTVGFKPTYGRISRYGLVAFASSFDQIGPFTTTTEDVALVMEILGRHCAHDATSVQLPPDNYFEKLKTSLHGMKFGVPWHFLEALDADAKNNFTQSIEVIKNLGGEIIDIDLDILKYSIAVYYILTTAEASSNLARFDGIRYGKRSARAKTLDEVYEFSREEGFGSEVKNRILLGTFVLSSGYQDAYYKQGQKFRSLIIEHLNKAFAQCDLIAMPCSPFAAFELGTFNDPLQMYLQDIYTVCANLAGLPAISIPSGFNAENKPFGIQFMGPRMHDAQVVGCAHAFEKATNFTQNIPPLFDHE